MPNSFDIVISNSVSSDVMNRVSLFLSWKKCLMEFECFERVLDFETNENETGLLDMVYLKSNAKLIRSILRTW